MFGKSCLIIGGSVLIREVDFRMFGKSCLIIGGSVLIRGVDFRMFGKSCYNRGICPDKSVW